MDGITLEEEHKVIGTPGTSTAPRVLHRTKKRKTPLLQFLTDPGGRRTIREEDIAQIR